MIFRSALVVGGFAIVFASGLGAVACGSGTDATEPACLPAPVDVATCKPQYEPTYANVFKYTLSPTCGAGGCHSGPDPKGGMALDQVDTARTNLLAAASTGGPRVTPGDVKCGKVVVRLESVGDPWSMPPAPGHLGDAELCSVMQWIAQGANP